MSEQDGYNVGDELARPGAVTYLHLPAPDVRRAAAFYRDVFDWTVDGADGDRPSFSDASGLLSGQWRSQHLAVTEPGVLPYIYVADVAQTVQRIVTHGGEIATEPFPEGLLTVALFRDPAGNVLGLWHDTTRDGRAADGEAGDGEPGDVGARASADQAAVSPVPEHLHTVTPRLMVRDAAAAIDFYVAAFGAVEIGERHSMPDGTLVHAELRIGDSIVMLATGDDDYTALLCTYWPDVDAAWARAVEAGAEVLHPLADQFYGERGGRVRDPFGQEWMLSARLERLTAAEIAARAQSEG